MGKHKNNQTLEVRRQSEMTGADSERTYVRITPAILRADMPLPFRVYRREGEDTLRLVAEENSAVPGALLNHTVTPEGGGIRFYVRADQRDALVHYQEGILEDVLRDRDLAVDAKCEIVQSQTTLLSQEMFERPTSAQISRQRKTIREMVDLVVREPDAMHGLLGLTHYDYHTYTHSVNVGVYALWLLVEHFHYKTDLDMHETAASYFLHDIGKCRVDPAIINKPGRLDAAEWVEIRKHPDHGYAILMEEMSLTPETALVVMQHHERMDGLGYPKGLKGEEVHPYARVCSLVDAFDALTTRRSYKAALTRFDALNLMKDEMSMQFDAEIFRSFVLLCQKQG